MEIRLRSTQQTKASRILQYCPCNIHPPQRLPRPETYHEASSSPHPTAANRIRAVTLLSKSFAKFNSAGVKLVALSLYFRVVDQLSIAYLYIRLYTPLYASIRLFISTPLYLCAYTFSHALHISLCVSMEERHKQRHETRAQRHGQRHGYRVYDLRYPSPVRARRASNFATSAGNLVPHATFGVLLQVVRAGHQNQSCAEVSQII